MAFTEWCRHFNHVAKMRKFDCQWVEGQINLEEIYATEMGDWVYRSVVEHILSMYEVLDSITGTTKKKLKKNQNGLFGK